MDTQKKSKIIRIVSLIALTVIVIAGIVLTVFFVQKTEPPTIKYINGEVNKTIELDEYNFIVSKLNFEGVDDENVKMTITISIEAKEDTKIFIEDFKVNNYELESQSGFKETINSGEILEFQLNYVVKLDQELLYLIYNNIKIALGEAHA